MQTNQQRASAYLECMPPAIGGSGGHAATFNAAAVLVRGFAFSEQDSLPLLAAWNQTHCQPPWTEAELRHKLRSAATSTRPLGYLLDQVAVPYRDCTAPDFENEAERKTRQRKAWPEFRRLTTSEIHAVANLRGILPDAVDLLHRVGILRGAVMDGHQSFIMLGEHFAQARRFDGLPFVRHDADRLKAKNLPGSVGAFIGHPLLFPNAGRVLLLEGCIGLLEGVAALLGENVPEAWSVIAATSASSRFARDPDLLKSLAGRRVVILPDADDAGLDAAASWLADLEGAGASVEAFELPSGAKDLGDLISNPAKNQKTIDRIFL